MRNSPEQGGSDMSLIDMSLNRRRAFNGESASAAHFRPRFEVLEARECPAVTAPTGVQLSLVSATQVKISWNDVANETGYRIFQWNGTQTVQIGAVGANVKTFTANGLTPNQVQWFIVQAIDRNSSANSSWASITTPADAITVPTNIKVASATLSTVTLTWNDSTGETGYRIFMWDGTKAVQAGTVAANTTAFQVKNLNAGQTYYFYVQAYNANNTATSAWLTGATLSNQFTGPTNLVAQTAGSDKINLTWTDGNGEANYRVYRWDGNSGTTPVLIASLGANVTSYQATGLLPGKQYWYYVQGVNSANTVANSSWASATTTPVAVLQAPTPARVDYTGVRNSIVVSWTEPEIAVGYRVHIWNGYAWQLYKTVDRGTTSVRVDSLTIYRTHWFLVEAFTESNAQVAYSNALWINL